MMSSFKGPSRNDVPKSIPGYIIHDKLGAGSYAVVYRATQVENNQEFAVKCIEKNRLSASGRENIINEIKIMKMLNHPYIVKLFDFHWDKRYIYLVLEYCNGGDLSSFIKKRRKVPEIILHKFIQQLTLGLKFLRSQNIAHFDLKPQNLLLTRTPKLCIKIADFGFADFLRTDCQMTSVRGSPLYMAPEMLLKHDYTEKADLWSVGIIYYECLFGCAPLPHNNFCQLLKSVEEQVPIKLPDTNISEECADLLRRLLVYDPKLRIDFVEFFNHPFIDLEHFPSEQSYEKAISLVHEAVKLDYNKEYTEAFRMYCKALQYLVPYLNDLNNSEEKKEVLSKKVKEYTARAEELKCAFLSRKNNTDEVKPTTVDKSTNQQQPYLTDGAGSSLVSLCASTPKMKAALEMGYIAQMYLVEGDYVQALEKTKSALSDLLPLLKVEPPGRKKDLLMHQVDVWLTQAENVKVILSARKPDLEDESIQGSFSDMCKLQ